MELNQDEFAKLIETVEGAVKKEVEEAIDKKFGPLRVGAKKHYDDHNRLNYCAAHWDEIQKNHEYVSNLRSASKMVKKWAGWSIVTTSVIGFITWFLFSVFGIKL